MSSIARNVLLADDDTSFVTQMATCLRQMGHVAHIASTPEAALEAARTLPIDVVIIEPNQRGMAWVRFMRAVRTTLSTSHIMVVTAFGSTAMLSESAALGVHSFLPKPTCPAEVVESLNGTCAWPSRDTAVSACMTLDQCSWEYLNGILRRCDGNVSETCRRLGIPRQTLYYKLRKQPRGMSFIGSAMPALNDVSVPGAGATGLAAVRP